MFSFTTLPHNLYTQHVGQFQSRVPSSRLWTRFHGLWNSAGGTKAGYGVGDDFLCLGQQTVTSVGGESGNLGYGVYIEVDATAGAINQVADEVGGVARFLTSADCADGDNHQTSLVAGYPGGSFRISDTAGQDKALAFECCVKWSSITNADGSTFFGLLEAGQQGAATPLRDNSGHTLADDDAIGWLVTEDDNDSLKFVYVKAGQTLNEHFTYGTALVADTWYNLGFVYDPAAVPSKRISLYINGAEQANAHVTATDIATTDFPDGDILAPAFAIINSANNDPQNFEMDWWYCAQLR